MSFAQFMELARAAMGNHPEFVIGGAVALFTLVALGAVTRRRRRLNLATLVAASGPAASLEVAVYAVTAAFGLEFLASTWQSRWNTP